VAYDVGNYYCNEEDINVESGPEYHKDFRGEKYIRTQKSEYDKVL
jgi:hypothetical protein